MRKTILIVLLAIVSSSVVAEWHRIVGDEADTFYSDPATVRWEGNRVKMWVLIDFKTPKEDPSNPRKSFLSQKVQYEFDCKERQARILYFSWHSGNMGRGEVVHTNLDAGKWAPVPPESVIEYIWKLVCRER